RLGSLGRSSLSRVQFLAGDKPVSTTCSCTPLALPDGNQSLLLVGVDPIDAELRATAGELGPDALADTLFPPGTTYEVLEAPTAEAADATQLKAGPQDQVLVLRHSEPPVADIADIRAEEGESAD